MAVDELVPVSVAEAAKGRSPRMVMIKPTSGWHLIDLREMWNYRELIYFLTWREVKVRYKQTAIGAAWAVLQPLAMMIVFLLFFNKLAKVDSGNVPYPVFAYAGLMPWQLFSRAITSAASSLVNDRRLITKVYFPRIIVPSATVLAGMVDFAVSTGLLVVLMVIYGVTPGTSLLLVPLVLVLMLVTALGVGFWLSALNAEYRDVAYTMPFLNQFWLFITPVVYPTSLVPEQWRLLYGLNPMAGVVEGFRWAVTGVGPLPWQLMAMSAVVGGAIFLSGMAWFRRCERTFVDVIGSGG
ncbi:ABC-2 type transporter [Thermobaculum terrenum ATCC BAA-798]|uniref:Transport permease protein n=1 Tax=Thermobaculum terrenum (strain ATCC BAA-798 / CCMEE 7001 / YNP1) TaxID=525904 RepID=D1CIW7_THET1|nr:ABC transporter permease [Thermobaculum terrenum]ACZ43687.1 ABC-2 type transporter [Thermobaculum terrenum ATCC BAA-798]